MCIVSGPSQDVLRRGVAFVASSVSRQYYAGCVDIS